MAKRWPARSSLACGQTATTASCQLLDIVVLEDCGQNPPNLELAAWSSQNDDVATLVEQLQEDAGVPRHGGMELAAERERPARVLRGLGEETHTGKFSEAAAVWGYGKF
jgi:hypothetical protein